MERQIMENIKSHIHVLESQFEKYSIDKLNEQNKSFRDERFQKTMSNDLIDRNKTQCKYYMFEIAKNKTILNIVSGECSPAIFSSDDCMICTEKYILKAVLFPCRHVLCTSCVSMMLKKNNGRFACPMCRQNVDGYEYLNNCKYDFCKLK